MKDKYIIFIIGALLVITSFLQIENIVGFISLDFTQLIISIVVKIAAIIYLFLRNKHPYSYVLKFFMIISAVVLLISFPLKIIHHPFANAFILVGAILIIFSYLLRFFQKNNKQNSDYLKLIWVTMFVAEILFSLMHDQFEAIHLLSELILFPILFIAFGYEILKTQKKHHFDENILDDF